MCGAPRRAGERGVEGPPSGRAEARALQGREEQRGRARSLPPQPGASVGRRGHPPSAPPRSPARSLAKLPQTPAAPAEPRPGPGCQGRVREAGRTRRGIQRRGRKEGCAVAGGRARGQRGEPSPSCEAAAGSCVPETGLPARLSPPATPLRGRRLLPSLSLSLPLSLPPFQPFCGALPPRISPAAEPTPASPPSPAPRHPLHKRPPAPAGAPHRCVSKSAGAPPRPCLPQPAPSGERAAGPGCAGRAGGSSAAAKLLCR